MTARRRSATTRAEAPESAPEPILAPQGPHLTTERGGARNGARTSLCFVAPYPPSTNALYATVNGRRVKTRAAKAYADTVALIVKVARQRGGDPGKPPYALRLDLYPPSRRPDATNSVKCLEDALFKAIDQNDRTVQRVVIEKHDPDPADPRVRVVLEPAGEGGP